MRYLDDHVINRACRGHLAGMTNRYLLFIPVAVLGCGGAGMQPDELDELDELESVQADTAAPVITSVMTDDGFRQIRQDGLSHLVVRGNHLDTATSVTVGASLAEIESIAPHEVRASVFAPPGLLGHVDVTVVTAAGTATRPDALRVTPWVMSPTAVGGHGTFQSPMNLCDLEFDPAQPGDTVQLLAGVYECSSFLDLNDGITFEGAGRDKTLIQGSFVFLIAFGPATATTTIRDLTFLAPVLPDVLVGNLVVERVTSTIRFFIGNGGNARFDRYAFEGPGTGVEVENASAEIANSTIRNCGGSDGIALGGTQSGAHATLDNVVIEGCDRGVFLTGPQFPFSQLIGSVTIANSKLIDNRIGVFLSDGTATVQNTEIRDDETTPQIPETGIVTVNGDVNVVGARISGQRFAGIAVSLSSFFDPGADLTVSGTVIDGGTVGIGFGGTDELSSLHVRSSKIRGQTVAAVAVGGDSTIDLSSADTPDDPNVFSTVSGFALSDGRTFVSPFHKYIDATGTRLNGVVFPTQLLDGPVSLAPYFRIASSESGIRF
ncbi:MAG: hypothetical protein E6J90_34280 [Deltaproteobacteria bacterium]|nr:MAG: hypothetical protein E6J90_34280 [Deltaproteobacteria bacterium]